MVWHELVSWIVILALGVLLVKVVLPRFGAGG
jgi:uncharacterized protein YhdP